MPLISVIMSVHNGEKTLAEAIESILNQTEQDFEFIICNDKSSDKTGEILEYYKQIDERIIILSNKENLGLSRSLNRCLEIARGLYVARMDDDDISYRTRFEKQINFLKHNLKYSFVSSVAVMYDGEKQIGITNNPEIPSKSDFLHCTPYIHPATMFRSKALVEVAGYSEKNMVKKRAQDYELFMRMAAKGLVGYNIQEPLLEYYFSPIIAQKKRSIENVWNEMKIRACGFKQMHMKVWEYVFVFVPIYVYLKQGITCALRHR